MKVTLVVDGGEHNGKEIPISINQVRIGREEKNNIRLDSEDVSRHHCTLVIEKGEVLLRDEASSNGTFVNKRRLRGEIQLEHNDSIQVGPQLFTITIEADDADGSMEESVLTPPPAVEDSDATLLGRIPVIDPGDLAAAEKARLRERLRDLGKP